MPAILIILALIGAGAAIAGAIIEGAGQQQQIDAQAQADALQAQNLLELAGDGGYYDEVMQALKIELDDIEADREAAATNLQLTEQELSGQIELSKLEEAAQMAGLGAQKVGIEAEKAGKISEGLETGERGAQATGKIAAAAGASGVSVGSGSILRSAAAVGRAVARRVGLANIGIGAANLEIGATTRQMQATEMAGALQRTTLQNNITRAQLNYQDLLRGLNTREAQLEAQQTLTEYQRETAGEQAWTLASEAAWLQGPGTALNILGTIFNAAGAGAAGASRIAGSLRPTGDVSGGLPGWGGTTMQPETVHDYLGGAGTPTSGGVNILGETWGEYA